MHGQAYPDAGVLSLASAQKGESEEGTGRVGPAVACVTFQEWCLGFIPVDDQAAKDFGEMSMARRGTNDNNFLHVSPSIETRRHFFIIT